MFAVYLTFSAIASAPLKTGEALSFLPYFHIPNTFDLYFCFCPYFLLLTCFLSAYLASFLLYFLPFSLGNLSVEPVAIFRKNRGGAMVLNLHEYFRDS